MDEWKREQIDSMYENIMAQIRGGSVYGEKVSEEDVKALVVAAYFVGSHDELAKQYDRWERRSSSLPGWTGGRS